ncbi:MAG: hypothetical protein AAFR84_15945 [Pseudomonadota bacterium]
MIPPGVVALAVYWWRRAFAPDGQLSADRLAIGVVLCMIACTAAYYLPALGDALLFIIFGPMTTILLFLILCAHSRVDTAKREEGRKAARAEKAIARAARRHRTLQQP